MALKLIFWRKMAILRLRSILFTTLRWTAAWALIGLLLGIAMTLRRVPPIAEPGAPSGYAFYVFWIPLCLGAASVFGLLLALSYSVLLADLWMPRSGSPLVTQPNSFMTTYGWRAICGAIAGGVIGWPVMKDWSAMWVVGMGIASGTGLRIHESPQTSPPRPVTLRLVRFKPPDFPTPCRPKSPSHHIVSRNSHAPQDSCSRAALPSKSNCPASL
jgi:hypothetical protein